MNDTLAWLIGWVVFILLMLGWARTHYGSKSERQDARAKDDDFLWKIGMEMREERRRREKE